MKNCSDFAQRSSPGAFSEVVAVNDVANSDVYGNSSCCGRSCDLPPINNTLNIDSGASVGSAYGGYSCGDSVVTGNTVNVNGGTVSGEVYGGRAYNGDATGNAVTVNGASTVSGFIVGGYTQNGAATGNTVTISGGTVRSIDGAWASTYNATGNAITISGGTVSGDVTGGWTWDNTGSSEATYNTVTISGNPTFGPNTWLSGGLGGVDNWTGNTLNLKTPVSVCGVADFQFYNFYLPSALTAGQIMLTVTNKVDIRGSAIRVGIDGDASVLNAGDKVVLIRCAGLIADASLNGSHAQGIQDIQGVSRIYDFVLSTDAGNLYATVSGVRLAHYISRM